MNYKIIVLGLLIVLLSSLSSYNFYIVVIFTLLVMVLLPVRSYIDNIALCLMSFSFFYGVVMLLNGSVDGYSKLVSYVLSPTVFYLLGKYFVNIVALNQDRLRLMLFLILAFMIPIFVHTLEDIRLVGLVNPTRAMLANINDGKSINATLYGLNASVGIGCASVIFLMQRMKFIKWGYIFAFFIAILVTIHLINRTGLVILAVSLLCNMVVYSQNSFKKTIQYGIILTTIVLVVTQSGIIGDEIIDSYMSREMNEESDMSTGGGRFERWSNSISNFIVSPFGWERTFFSHNMWLDLARVGGWFAFFPFLIVTIKIIKKTIRMIQINRSSFALIVFSINISMLMAAFVEPVIEGSFTFFLLLMVIWGIISSISKEVHASNC